MKSAMVIGLLEGKVYKTGRYKSSTGHDPGKLLPSGLLGGLYTSWSAGTE